MSEVEEAPSCAALRTVRISGGQLTAIVCAARPAWRWRYTIPGRPTAERLYCDEHVQTFKTKEPWRSAMELETLVIMPLAPLAFL